VSDLLSFSTDLAASSEVDGTRRLLSIEAELIRWTHTAIRLHAALQSITRTRLGCYRRLGLDTVGSLPENDSFFTRRLGRPQAGQGAAFSRACAPPDRSECPTFRVASGCILQLSASSCECHPVKVCSGRRM